MRIVNSLVVTVLSIAAIIVGIVVLLYGLSMIGSTGRQTLTTLGLNPDKMPEVFTQDQSTSFIQKFPSWAQSTLQNFRNWFEAHIKPSAVDLSGLQINTTAPQPATPQPTATP
jgi:hypothetical protein